MTSQPYTNNPGLNRLYQLVLADNPALYDNPPSVYPWNILFADKQVPEKLLQVGNDESCESRLRLLAYHLVRQQDIGIAAKILLGVVVEVGLDEGLDVLASYADGTARYFNYSGNMIVWDVATPESEAIRKPLFALSDDLVRKIGPWDKPRRAHPARDVVRVSFLVSDGLYFGEGPLNVMFQDASAGPLLEAATRLMQFLINQQIGPE